MHEGAGRPDRESVGDEDERLLSRQSGRQMHGVAVLARTGFAPVRWTVLALLRLRLLMAAQDAPVGEGCLLAAPEFAIR